MMSTLLISETFPPKTGGSGRWFWEIYRRQPIDQYIIAAGLDPHQQAFDLTQELRVTRMPLGFSDLGMFSLRGWKGYWAALRGLLQLVREHNVDQVHAGRCLPKVGLPGSSSNAMARPTFAMSMARKSSCLAAVKVTGSCRAGNCAGSRAM
jgi:hypothetical protein